MDKTQEVKSPAPAEDCCWGRNTSWDRSSPVGLEGQCWRSETWLVSLSQCLLSFEDAAGTNALRIFLLSSPTACHHSELPPGLSFKWPPQAVLIFLVLEAVSYLVTNLPKFWVARSYTCFSLKPYYFRVWFCKIPDSSRRHTVETASLPYQEQRRHFVPSTLERGRKLGNRQAIQRKILK